MTVSTVPAALSALFALGQDVLPPAVLNVYGQPMENLPADFAAWGWNDGQGAVTMTQSLNDAGYAGGAESYDIASHLVSWRGGAGEVQTAVEAVYNYLNLIDGGLRADPHLGDTVMFAQITTSSLTIAQSTKGPIASLGFIVSIQATK